MKIKCPKCKKTETPTLVKTATIAVSIDDLTPDDFKDFMYREDRESTSVDTVHVECGNCTEPLLDKRGSRITTGQALYEFVHGKKKFGMKSK